MDDMTYHSPDFYMIKDYYDQGLWKKKAVKNMVKRGKITEYEYQEITGEPYTA